MPFNLSSTNGQLGTRKVPMPNTSGEEELHDYEEVQGGFTGEKGGSSSDERNQQTNTIEEEYEFY